MGGLFGGGKGMNFKAQGADPAQMKKSWEDTQASIKQQQEFVDQLKAQNGLANQSSVFQQQQGLANQFQNIANGEGPNPAQAMLAQQTGQNVSNQAALMASQRGASANTGLMARQAAMQGGNMQQQATGQAATLQAQQSLGALGQLQQQQSNMGNVANQQVTSTQAGLQNLGQQSSSQQSNVYGLQQSANSANAQIQAQNAQSQGNMIGSLMGAAGTVIGGIYGGPAGAMAGGAIGSGIGGALSNNDMSEETGDTGSDVADSSLNMDSGMSASAKGGAVDELPVMGPRSHYGKMLHMAKGGKVKAMVAPGEVYLDTKDVKKVAEGKKHPMDGQKIGGKPKVGGAKDSYKNDTVRKDLDEGGIVLPRSVTKAKDSERKAIEFVEAILAKHKHKK